MSKAANVELAERLSVLNSVFVLTPVLIFLISTAIVTVIWDSVRNKTLFSSPESILAATYIINAIYLLIISTKFQWHLLISLMTLSPLLLIPILRYGSPKARTPILLGILGLQLITFVVNFDRVYPPTKNAESHPRVTHIEHTLDPILHTQSTIDAIHILRHPSIVFDYLKHGIHPQQVHTIFGPFSRYHLYEKEHYEKWDTLLRLQKRLNIEHPIKPFYEKEYIMMLNRKDLLEAPVIKNILSGKNTDYRLITRNHTLLVFKKTP